MGMRYGKRTRGGEDHMLRFSRIPEDHMLRFSRIPEGEQKRSHFKVLYMTLQQIVAQLRASYFFRKAL